MKKAIISFFLLLLIPFIAIATPPTKVPPTPITPLNRGADPPCFNNNTDRYQDCDNGTVTDTVTGLIWLKDAACLGEHDWTAANTLAAVLKSGDCGLTDHSSAGEWRLPTREEWDMTIDRAVALGCTGARAPSLTDTEGKACYSLGPQPFIGVQSNPYWSSSTFAGGPAWAWLVVLDVGVTSNSRKVFALAAWPVRGGQ